MKQKKQCVGVCVWGGGGGGRARARSVFKNNDNKVPSRSTALQSKMLIFNKTIYTMHIYLAISYILYLSLLTLVQYPKISMKEVRTGYEAK